VEFRDPRDGSQHFLSPERCIEIQQNLGADLIVVLDEFEPIGPDSDDAARSSTRAMLERTLRWAARCRSAHTRSDQLLFGIVQGGGFEDLRRESAERTAELGFRAFAIGGLGLGEDLVQRLALSAQALTRLPPEAPRYLMGLGLPEDLVGGVELGVDMFDCVIPTRHGRHGSVFTSRGTLNLRNARFKDDPEPVSSDCACPVCARYSRAYLRHLIHSGEALGARLLSLHNVAFYMDLMRQMRVAIAEDRFAAWAEDWRKAQAR
jgi:queuine tRNA-ribosyltransferase